MGSPIFADLVPEADDLMAARLRAAGAIVIGKTNMPEFGLGSHSFNPVFGVTRNPYDLDRAAGGSSGGAAAALAARMVCVADGSDMMGSLRNPAAFCNVYGMPPDLGPGAWRAGGRSVPASAVDQRADGAQPGDLAALLETLAGPDPACPGAGRFAPAI